MDEEENYRFPEGDSIDENPADEDIQRFERDDFVQCQHCKKYNHPEALTCRFCKHFITDEHHQPPSRPLWIRITLIGMLILAILAVFVGFGGSIIHFNFKDWHG